MTIRLGGIIATALLALASVAAAQPAADGQPTPSTAGSAAAEADVDVNRLPIDLSRIQRKLETANENAGRGLRFDVQVFGVAPPLVFFTPEDNLLFGPAPYGAPTHQDMLNMLTPQEFSAPAADFDSLIRWWAARQKREQQRR